jgi:hypothetical protein
MKYLLTSPRDKNNTQLLLENIVPAKTAHIVGYGLGVTFTTKGFDWQQNCSISSIKMLGFTQPTVITQ